MSQQNDCPTLSQISKLWLAQIPHRKRPLTEDNLSRDIADKTLDGIFEQQMNMKGETISGVLSFEGEQLTTYDVAFKFEADFVPNTPLATSPSIRSSRRDRSRSSCLDSRRNSRLAILRIARRARRDAIVRLPSAGSPPGRAWSLPNHPSSVKPLLRPVP